MRLFPLVEHVCCRLSEDQDQFHEISRFHLAAERKRGSSGVIDDNAQRAGSVTGLTGSPPDAQPAILRTLNLGMQIAGGLGSPTKLRRGSQTSR